MPSGIRTIAYELTEQAGRKLVPCGGLPNIASVVFDRWPVLTDTAALPRVEICLFLLPVARPRENRAEQHDKERPLGRS